MKKTRFTEAQMVTILRKGGSGPGPNRVSSRRDAPRYSAQAAVA